MSDEHEHEHEMQIMVEMDGPMTQVVMQYTEMNRRLRAIDEVHARIQAPHINDEGEHTGLVLVSCSCQTRNQWIWKPGDEEPDWKCATRKILDGEV